MNRTGKLKFHRIYTILFAVFTLAVGLVLISQVWGIFRSAPEKAFSRASVGARLIKIAPVLVLWLIGLLGNILLSALTPKAVIPLKGEVDSADTLKNWQRKFVHSGKEVAGVQKVRAVRWLITLVGGAAVLFIVLFALSYLFDEEYTVKRGANIFTIHDGAADRLLCATPWLAAALLLGFLISFARDHTRREEISLLKGAFADAMRKKKLGDGDEAARMLREKGEAGKTTVFSEKLEKFTKEKAKQLAIARLALRIGLFIAAIVLIVLGVNWGGMDLVFEKARTICQQCIGLG